MKQATTLILGLIILLGGCRSFQPVEVGRPGDLKVASLSGSKVNLEISVPIKNPNIYKITVTRIQADAYINNTKAGKITSNDKIRLEARSDKVHNLKLGIDFSNLLGSDLNVLDIMRENRVDLSIDGTLTTRSFLYSKEVPFKQERSLKFSR
jgi:LEA14-like dessication related protein